jgi:hypothetical protein
MKNNVVLDVNGIKRCCRCKKEKPICEFGIQNRRGRSQPHSACKECLAKKARDKRAIFGSRWPGFDIMP